jgi:hypothetical protein
MSSNLLKLNQDKTELLKIELIKCQISSSPSMALF